MPALAPVGALRRFVGEAASLATISLVVPEVDPMWPQVDRRMGGERSAELRRHLRGEVE